jgi:hypothetical protein
MEDNNKEKLEFVTKTFPQLAAQLDANTKGAWGVMNAQQMVEHMSYSVRIANGKLTMDIVTPAENLEKVKGFMMSDKPFRENTKNSMLPDTALPTEQPDMQHAIEELKNELELFVQVFKKEPNKIITNPFFGDLNFDEWLHLLHKHLMHHARQFGLV